MDPVTVSLLQSVLNTSAVRNLFTSIAKKRIADVSSIDTDTDLEPLKNEDLIGSSTKGDKVFVTAKGLKVARELGKLGVR